VKKTQKWAKNERDSCMPRAIFAERPYLAPRKPVFRDPILGCFSAIFAAFPSHSIPHTYPAIKLIINKYVTQFMPALYYTSNSQLIHT